MKTIVIVHAQLVGLERSFLICRLRIFTNFTDISKGRSLIMREITLTKLLKILPTCSPRKSSTISETLGKFLPLTRFRD